MGRNAQDRVVSAQGNPQATSLADESLVLAWEAGDLWTYAYSLNTRARIALHKDGDYERAATFADEALVSFRKIGSASGMVMALRTAGVTAMQLGDLPKASALLEETCMRGA